MVNTLPSEGYVRLAQILGDPGRELPPIFPVSRATWYRGIREGEYPQPVKFGRMSLWRAEDIRALLEKKPGPERQLGA